MNYKELLRVRSIFIAFACTLVAITLLVFLLSGHATAQISLVDPARASTVHAATVHASITASDGDTTNIHAPGIEVSSNANNHMPFAVLLAAAGFIAAIFATIVGTCLAAENCGHLEIAWTRPASRVAYATRLMLVDVIGILAIFAFTVALLLALVYAKGWQGYLYLDNDVLPLLARFVAYPLAWFGLVAGLSASTRGRAGAIAGFSWAGAVLLVILMTLDLPPAIHSLVVFINYINPLLYGSYSTETVNSRHMMGMTHALAISGLLGIAIVGTGAALAQWRRLEA